MIQLSDEITQDKFAEQIANIRVKKPVAELVKPRLELFEGDPVVQARINYEQSYAALSRKLQAKL